MSAQLPHLGGHLGQLMQAGDATSPTCGFGGRDAVVLAQVQVVGPNHACREMKGTTFSLAPFSFSCNIKLNSLLVLKSSWAPSCLHEC